ncbi:MAG: aminoacyl-tRNA hydrolase [Hyphomicrobiaceae bacterium]|nr:aminoacyl-tRNA hydrolase [Hyphomicrobiaceae bacterium]
MRLFVGLGNPGEQYARNRHNIGFMAVETIARRHRFSPWRAKFHGEICEGELGGEKVLLLKPLTYMNDSGRAVAAAAAFYKIDPADIVVFHDELDLAPAKLKVKLGGGHAGHNGLRSIIAHLGEAFRRVRLGIGHPGAKDRVTGWVLGDFAKVDADWLDPMLTATADCADRLVAGDDTAFMTEVARLTRPQRDPTPPPAPKPAANADGAPAPVAAAAPPRPARPNEVSVNAMAETLKRLLAAKPPGGRKGPR